MRKSSILVLKKLFTKAYSVSELAEETGLAVSSVSEAIEELLLLGLVFKNKKIGLASNALTHETLTVASQFSLIKLLHEKKQSILIHLIEPKELKELSKAVSLSEAHTFKLVNELREFGAVIKSKENKYYLNEKILNFAKEFKKSTELRQIEANAILLFSNGFKLKKLPLKAGAKGSLTAFSVFHEFNVDCMAINDYFVEPEHDVSIEEVFVHALVASENKKDLALCLILFLKNIAKIDLQKTKKIAKEFKVIDLLSDCLAFLEQEEVKKPEKFLPFNEFQAIALDYDVKVQKKFSKNELKKLLEEIGKTLAREVNVYLIGGCNLSLQGIKRATKDIDLVVKNTADFETITNTLKKMGFIKQERLELAYKKMNPSAVFEKTGSARIDLFTKIICNALSLSKEMTEKTSERRFGKLMVNFLKPEDIILFKSITERERDFEDIVAIAQKQDVNWQYLLKELTEQQETHERLFCLNVLDTIESLEEREAIISPVKKQILNLCLEKSILFLLEKPRTVKEIKEKISFSETKIRNELAKQVREGTVKKIESKPKKFVIQKEKNKELKKN